MTSGIGFLLCVAVMFIIQWYYALGIIILAAALLVYIDYRGVDCDWGSG